VRVVTGVLLGGVSSDSNEGGVYEGGLDVMWLGLRLERFYSILGRLLRRGRGVFASPTHCIVL